MVAISVSDLPPPALLLIPWDFHVRNRRIESNRKRETGGGGRRGGEEK